VLRCAGGLFAEQQQPCLQGVLFDGVSVLFAAAALLVSSRGTVCRVVCFCVQQYPFGSAARLSAGGLFVGLSSDKTYGFDVCRQGAVVWSCDVLYCTVL
jgi:hypothetical protein